MNPTFDPDKFIARIGHRWVRELYQTGKTSDARAFDRYFLQKENPIPVEPRFVSKGNMTTEELIQILTTGQ